MRRTILTILTVTAFVCACGTVAVAQVSIVTVAATSISLRVRTATPGAQPTAVTGNTTYGVVVHQKAGHDHEKITGHLNSNMPTGLTLSLNLAAPVNAISQGTQPMSTTPVDLVIDIDHDTIQTGVNMTFTLSATASAGPVASSNKTLTLTILDGA